MAERLPDTSEVPTKSIAQAIEDMKSLAEGQRKTFARHWYDNNFFDDGHHFRFISRTTGRIVDLSEKATLYAPKRAIPKASRQIRGMANLLLSTEPTPIIYPEKVTHVNYPSAEEYKLALDESKMVAKRTGHWIEEEWKAQDLRMKLAQMVLLAMKNCVSYIQIWPDPVEEAIKTQVYDAFDIYLVGNLTSIYDSPFIGKEVPKTIKEIKANENFDEEQLEKIHPDNKYASDEIKEAYLASKFGTEGRGSDAAATLLLKEWFIKEYINKDNMAAIRKSEQGGDILKDKGIGDPVLRQVFTAGQIWLRDEYVNLPDYPFVDFRLEPGRIYQTSLMERFINANKSLDSVMSRVESFIHTMTVGAYMKRRGENFKLSNVSGGLVAEYDGTPPIQMEMTPLPAHVFRFIELLNSFIEEQGVTTTALGKIPKGVKAWGAIESLKASEFANLRISLDQLNDTIKRISEKMLDIADRHFVTPQTILRLERGEPDYFDVVGQQGVKARKKIKEEVARGTVPLKKEYRVNIQIEAGLGYTEEGKKGRMMEIANFVLGLAQAQQVSPEVVSEIVKQLLEVYKFGPTADLMEALDKMPGGEEEEEKFSSQQKEEIKVAFLEVIRDLKQAGGQEEPQQQPQGSRETYRTETIEEGKDGKKTKSELKLVEKQ